MGKFTPTKIWILLDSKNYILSIYVNFDKKSIKSKNFVRKPFLIHSLLVLHFTSLSFILLRYLTQDLTFGHISTPTTTAAITHYLWSFITRAIETLKTISNGSLGFTQT